MVHCSRSNAVLREAAGSTSTALCWPWTQSLYSSTSIHMGIWLRHSMPICRRKDPARSHCKTNKTFHNTPGNTGKYFPLRWIKKKYHLVNRATQTIGLGSNTYLYLIAIRQRIWILQKWGHTGISIRIWLIMVHLLLVFHGKSIFDLDLGRQMDWQTDNQH